MKKLTYHNTPETMSVEEAIELFQPDEKGYIHKSYILMEDVIPKEYLDNKEFMKAVIPTRCAYTYPTLLSYASYRLQADEELAIMSILKNGTPRGLDNYFNDPSDEKLAEIKKNSKYLIIKEYDYDCHHVVKIKSRLLEDRAFLDKLLKEAEKSESFDRILEYLAEESTLFASDDKYMELAVSVDPELYYLYDGENQSKIILKAVETMFESGKFTTHIKSKFIKDQSKEVKSLLKYCAKVGELPDNAKIRQAIYKKICQHYLNKVKEQNVEQEDGLTL